MEKEGQSLLSGKKESRGRYSIYFYCTWILAFLLIGFIILSIVFIALFAVARYEANQAAQVCSSAGCVSLSTEMLSALDETKSPCDDFYHFACGGWERVNIIPEGVCVCVYLMHIGDYTGSVECLAHCVIKKKALSESSHSTRVNGEHTAFPGLHLDEISRE